MGEGEGEGVGEGEGGGEVEGVGEGEGEGEEVVEGVAVADSWVTIEELEKSGTIGSIPDPEPDPEANSIGVGVTRCSEELTASQSGNNCSILSHDTDGVGTEVMITLEMTTDSVISMGMSIDTVGVMAAVKTLSLTQ